MGYFEQFPYTNFHELNLDYILNEVKDAKNIEGKVLENFDEWLEVNDIENKVLDRAEEKTIRKFIMMGDSNTVDADYNEHYTAMSQSVKTLTTMGWDVLATYPVGGAAFSASDLTKNYLNMTQSIPSDIKKDCTDLVVFCGGNDANLTHTNYELFITYIKNYLIYVLNADNFPKLERLFFVHHAVLTGIGGRFVRARNNFISGSLDAYNSINSIEIPNIKKRVKFICESTSMFAQNWTENINSDGFHYNKQGQWRLARPTIHLLVNGTLPNYEENSKTLADYYIENMYQANTDNKIDNLFDSIRLSYFPNGSVIGYVNAFAKPDIPRWFEFDIPTNTIGYQIFGNTASMGRCVIRDSGNINNSSDVGFAIVKRDKNYTRIRVFSYDITLSSASNGKLLLTIPACY